MLAAPMPAVPPPALVRPVIETPRPRQISFGQVAGRVARGTTRIIVTVDGTVRADEPVAGTRFRVRVSLPQRDVTVRVRALDAAGHSTSSAVSPVYGLPPAGAGVTFRSVEDAALARRVRALARGFPGTASVFVQDLRTGLGASWNAGARFQAASTLKLAIAIEVLRVLPAPPRPGTTLDRLFRSMLVHSDNQAANDLETWLGGSTTGGAAGVNATMAALGLGSTRINGGYLVGTARRIPIRVESQPPYYTAGKYTTASDLGRIHRALHLAALGRGRLLRLHGSFTKADARFMLYTLAHVEDPGKLDRFLRRRRISVLHKGGWITTARHDSGLVYARRGSFVAVVMTWNGLGVGRSSDVLAGRVAAAALRRFTTIAGAAGADDGSTTL